MMLPVRLLLLTLGLSAGRLPAQVADPSPLASEQVAAQTVPGSWIMAENRADQALASGFPATAAIIYRGLLDDPSLPGEGRDRIGLALVTAELDAGDLAAAERTLKNYAGPKDSAYQLRAGLLAITARRVAAARAALAAGRVEDLPPADRGWWYFLEASVTDAEGDIVRANGLYQQAVGAAVSELQRARFVLGQEQARLRTGQASEAQLATLRGNMERFQGTRTGYTAVRTYAATLAELGRPQEAQAELQRQLAVLPATERDAADQLRLMLGLIAGEGSAAGRQAFRQLLRDGQRPETRRLALQLLGRGARTPEERSQLRRDLGELIAAPTANPIIEDLRLVRAQSALSDSDYTLAEEDARWLLDNFPASTLKADALGVRLTVAWNLKRYRTAADVIAQLRTILPPGRKRAELGVLLAEAYFRAEDYRNAADAYDAALREAPLAAPTGILIFQRVLAEIRSDRLEAAAKELDDAAAEPAFDPVNRWQAEWNLVRAMQVHGQTVAAYDRVSRLLGAGAQGVPAELRIRLMWLRARLAFVNEDPAAALRLAEELLAWLQQPADALDQSLRDTVTSTTLLLQAQALLALGRDPEGFAVLDRLRADYRDTTAAQNSYLVQSGHLSQRGDLAAALRVLIDFVNPTGYPRSEYAPLALYQAALILERQGLDRQLEEANKLLERLITDYPAADLVFYARLKQGDLMRKLNEFSLARQCYEDLVNNHGQHPDVLLAHLALADSLLAQGANVSNYESAVAIYERLRDLPSAPPDLRVEAGFKWGSALAKRGQGAKALTVYWSVVQGFLLDAPAGAALGAKGRYWLSKSLLELGQLHEEAGRLDEAQRAYQLILDNRLSGAAMAQAKLARYRPAGGTAP